MKSNNNDTEAHEHIYRKNPTDGIEYCVTCRLARPTNPSDDTKNLHVDDMVGYVSWDDHSDDSIGLDSAGLSDNRFGRFDQELIDKYFNENGVAAIQSHVNQALTNQLKALMGEAKTYAHTTGKNIMSETTHIESAIPISVVEDAINRLEKK